jgi:FkbM family methyltransferase
MWMRLLKQLKRNFNIDLNKSEMGLTKPTFNYQGNLIHHSCESDHKAVIREIFLKNSYDMSFCPQGRYYESRALINEEPINILDLGAHIGASTVYFSSRFKKANIISVEPSNYSFNYLCRNTELISRITPFNAMVDVKNSDNVHLWDNLNGSWSYGAIKYHDDAKLIGMTKAVTLKYLVSQFTHKDYFLLKVDIEGAEGNLFDSKENEEILNLFDVVVVEIHDWMLPGKMTALKVFKWAVRSNREICIKAENVWFFKPN